MCTELWASRTVHKMRKLLVTLSLAVAGAIAIIRERRRRDVSGEAII